REEAGKVCSSFRLGQLIFHDEVGGRYLFQQVHELSGNGTAIGEPVDLIEVGRIKTGSRGNQRLQMIRSAQRVLMIQIKSHWQVSDAAAHVCLFQSQRYRVGIHFATNEKEGNGVEFKKK